MSENFGYKVVLRVDGSIVVCFRQLTLTHNGELVDITDSCSQGYRELAFDPAVRSVDLGISAIMKQKLFRQKVFSGTPGSLVFQNAELVWPRMDGASGDGDVLAGTFIISSYGEGIPHDTVVTFDATLQSTGIYTYTPESDTPPTSSEPVNNVYFAASGNNGILHLYDSEYNITQGNITTVSYPEALLIGRTFQGQSPVVNPAILVAGSSVVESFDLAGQSIAIWFDFPLWPVCAALAKNDTYVAIAGRGGSPGKGVAIFNNSSGLATWQSGYPGATAGGAVAFSPDGLSMVYSHAPDFQGGGVYYCGEQITLDGIVSAGSIVTDDSGLDNNINSLLYSSDSQYIYVGFGNGVLQKLRASDMAVLYTFQAGTKPWNCLIEYGDYLIAGADYEYGLEQIFIFTKNSLSYVNSLGGGYTPPEMGAEPLVPSNVYSLDVDTVSGYLMAAGKNSSNNMGFIWLFDLSTIDTADIPDVDVPCSLTDTVCAKFV